MELQNNEICLTKEFPRIASITEILALHMHKTMNDLMIEGLKRKGFEFNNRIELEEFIKSKVRCEDRVDIKQRVYFANDIPFFLHDYNIQNDFNPIATNSEFAMSANLGRYAFLK
jgi:hypothetical protein